jgi:hypothetical protein
MEASTPIGTWYLLANVSRLELTITPLDLGFAATIANEGGASK